MKLKNLSFDDKKDWLKITDLENFFTLGKDKKSNYVYNLNQTLYFKLSQSAAVDYTCDHDMHWPLISYKLYGTTRLAWLLMKLNNVEAIDMFKKKLAGEKIIVISKDFVRPIVEDLNSNTND